jgi:hypothetical protein
VRLEVSFAVWPLGTGDATCYRCRTGCATFELAIAEIDDELHALRFTRCERCGPNATDGV